MKTQESISCLHEDKLCKRCGIKKKLKDFPVTSGTRHSPCYLCRRKKLYEWRKKNKDKLKIIDKRFYEKNKDRIIAQHECYRENSKLFNSEENRQKILSRSKKYRIRTPYQSWAQCTIRAHRSRGFIVLVKRDDLVAMAKKTPNCIFCDKKLAWAWEEKGKPGTAHNPTLDRTDNENVMTIDNVQIICHKCNAIKNNMRMKEFVAYCTKIVDKFSDIL